MLVIKNCYLKPYLEDDDEEELIVRFLKVLFLLFGIRIEVFWGSFNGNLMLSFSKIFFKDGFEFIGTSLISSSFESIFSGVFRNLLEFIGSSFTSSSFESIISEVFCWLLAFVVDSLVSFLITFDRFKDSRSSNKELPGVIGCLKDWSVMKEIEKFRKNK